MIYLLLSGLSEKEIAEQISRSLSTVKFHRSNIFQKVGHSCTGASKVSARQKKWSFYILSTFAGVKYIINHQSRLARALGMPGDAFADETERFEWARTTACLEAILHVIQYPSSPI